MEKEFLESITKDLERFVVLKTFICKILWPYEMNQKVKDRIFTRRKSEEVF